MSLLPVGLYGLEVPPVGVMIPAVNEASPPGAGYRITMAALDPTEEPEVDEDGNLPSVPRSTLKIIRKRPSLDDDLDRDYLERIMGADSDSDEEEDEDEDEDEDSDDEPNGGPSDPNKSKKAKKEAALMKLIEAAQQEDDSDDDMADADSKPNGVTKTAKKGKEPATSSDDDDDDESIDSEDLELEELVLCTLDTERNYQQTLDLTIGPGEQIFFVVKGTHTIHLTGNYIVENDLGDSDEEDEDDDYDLPVGINGIEDYDSDESEVDELDDIEDPRITEVDSEEEDKKPSLAAPDSKKGKNKRAAEEEADGLDDLIAKTKTKLSKKQQKKLKNNKGEAVDVQEKTPVTEVAKETPGKGDKKVQFAKNLEQGPTGSAAAQKGGSLGVKVVDGVTVDDRKIGKGRAVKKGDKVEVRYIGKTEKDGKVFDANKKGKPFSFTAGSGEVIKGWDIGVVGMSAGGERRLTIPAKLAYGNKSQPGIPANSQLIFDIKLLGIK